MYWLVSWIIVTVNLMKYVLFPCLGVVLRPGFIYGTRNVGSAKLPLGVIGSPLEMVSSCASLYIYLDYQVIPNNT